MHEAHVLLDCYRALQYLLVRTVSIILIDEIVLQRSAGDQPSRSVARKCKPIREEKRQLV